MSARHDHRGRHRQRYEYDAYSAPRLRQTNSAPPYNQPHELLDDRRTYDGRSTRRSLGYGRSTPNGEVRMMRARSTGHRRRRVVYDYDDSAYRRPATPEPEPWQYGRRSRGNSVESSWIADEPRYKVPRKEYLQMTFNTATTGRQSQSRPPTPIIKTQRSVTPVPAVRRRKLITKAVPVHKLVISLLILPAIVLIAVGGIYVWGSDLSDWQIALTVVCIATGSVITVTWLYLIVWHEQSVSKARVLTYLRLGHTLLYMVMGAACFGLGIYVYVRLNRNDDIVVANSKLPERTRQILALLSLAMGATVNVIGLLSLIVGVYAVYKLGKDNPPYVVR